MKQSCSGYFYILLCTLIFSLVEVVLKMVSGVFHPLQITALRFLIGGLVLLPFAIRSMRTHKASFHPEDAGFFALLGCLFVCVAMTLYQMAVNYTKAAVVAIIFSCNPIFVTVFACLILRERIRKNHVIALLIELLAILIIIYPAHEQLSPIGVTLGILSALLFALYSVLGKKRTANFGGIAVTCFSSLFGSLELILLLLFARTGIGVRLLTSLHLGIYCNVPLFTGIPLSALPWLIYIGAINTGFGFVCHMLAMEKTSAQEASLIFFLKPMLAPVFAFFFLREELTLNIILGIVCFLIGSGTAVIPGFLEQRKRLRNLEYKE